jgi:hypothetical protein
MINNTSICDVVQKCESDMKRYIQKALSEYFFVSMILQLFVNYLDEIKDNLFMEKKSYLYSLL